MFHRMYFVFIHVLLLFKQLENGYDQFAILLCRCIAFCKKLFQISDISADIGKLLADCFSDFLVDGLLLLANAR
jgi:hypothetical protein